VQENTKEEKMKAVKFLLEVAVAALLIGLIIFFVRDASAQSEYQVMKYLDDHGYSNKVTYVEDYKYLQTPNGIVIDVWKIPGVAKPDYTNLPSEAVSLMWYQEVKIQNDKPYLLKMVDNMYISFLTNDWTTVLRGYGLIASNQTITVTNTSSSQNIIYLITLKAYSKTDYYNMAGEFDRYRTQIERSWEELGWNKDDAMGLVRWHDLGYGVQKPKKMETPKVTGQLKRKK
jgi:hypothetical protein